MKPIKRLDAHCWRACVVVLFVVVLAATPLFAKGIRVIMTPSNAQPTAGERITVSIQLDVSQSQDLLGSLTASLKWNPQVLKFVSHSGGATEGFANPVVNDKEAGQGLLTFANASAKGAKGKINVLNLTFEVIGVNGDPSGLQIDFSALAGAYTFKDLLPQLNLSTDVKEAITIAETPKSYALLQNHPNPFNPMTSIQYALVRDEWVSLKVYDITGQEVATLVNEKQATGYHRVNFEAKGLPSGVYFYKLVAGNFNAVRKMLLVR